jgi:hypothetical protein
MTTVFEKSNEYGGFIIDLTDEGFVVHYHAYNVGDVDGLQVRVPFGTWGFERGTDLEASHHGITTNGEALAEMARDEARVSSFERRVEVLDEGIVLGHSVHRTSPTTAGFSATSSTAPVFGAEAREETGADHFSWYTFSLHKEDETGYGQAHDLFTTMYLTHGLPHGMALWGTSDYATGDNLFYAQIPEGLDVSRDDFFREFLPASCADPSHTGLSLLVGNMDDSWQASSAARRRSGRSRRTFSAHWRKTG